MTILLETPFNIGDIVCSKLNKEYTYIVNNFNILQTDENGTVTAYSMDCADPTGALMIFRPYEVDIVEKVTDKR